MKRKRESKGNILEIRPLNAEDAEQLWPVPIPVPELKTEADSYVKHWGMSESEARVYVITRFIEGGDLGPLAVHLAEGPIDPSVANLLVRMINNGQLKVVSKGGAPAQPKSLARDIMIFREHEGHTDSFAASIDRLAEKYRLSPKAIEAAITRVRGLLNPPI
jgi:hypothetical protein